MKKKYSMPDLKFMLMTLALAQMQEAAKDTPKRDKPES